MREFVLIFTAFLTSVSAFAQSGWVKPGAIWHFDINCLSSGGIRTVTYESDTIIQGRLAQQLSVFDNNVTIGQFGEYVYSDYEGAPIYLHLSGDTVYSFENDSFAPLFFIVASAGDTLEVSGSIGSSGCDYSKLIVDSTGMTNINGFQLDWYSPSRLDSMSDVGYHGKINERFGPMDGWFFPSRHFCPASPVDDCVYTLRCYQDDSFPLYNKTSAECDDLGLSVAENSIFIGVYPNPTNSLLQIESRLPIIAKTVYSLLGKTLLRSSDASNVLDVSQLLPGVYLLQVEFEEGVEAGRFVREP